MFHRKFRSSTTKVNCVELVVTILAAQSAAETGHCSSKKGIRVGDMLSCSVIVGNNAQGFPLERIQIPTCRSKTYQSTGLKEKAYFSDTLVSNLPTSPHAVTTHKTINNILTDVRTSCLL